MKYLYSIKIPEAALGWGYRDIKEVLWCHRLGTSLYDDIRLRGVKPIKDTEGWRYEVRGRKGEPLQVRVLDSYGKDGKPVFKWRDPQEGDYYVHFRDGTYDVMEQGLKDWYIKKWHEQQQRRAEATEEYQQLKEKML